MVKRKPSAAVVRLATVSREPAGPSLLVLFDAAYRYLDAAHGIADGANFKGAGEDLSDRPGQLILPLKTSSKQRSKNSSC